MEKKFNFYEPILDRLSGPTLTEIYFMSYGLTFEQARENIKADEEYFKEDFDELY